MIEKERPVEEADIAVKISPPGFSSQTVVEGRHRSNLVLDMFVYDYIQGVPKKSTFRTVIHQQQQSQVYGLAPEKKQ